MRIKRIFLNNDKLLLILLSIMVLFFSFILFRNMRKDEVDRFNKVFQTEIEHQSILLEKRLEDTIYLMNLLSRKEYHTGEMTQEAFEYVMDPVSNFNDYVKAVEWAPKVTYEMRAELENKMKRAGYKNFSIIDNLEDGTMAPSRDRKVYFPVQYILPMEGNEKAHGYDLYSNPLRAAAIDHAMNYGEITATAPIELVQDTKIEKAYLLFSPVYNDANFKGFVLSVYRYSALAEDILQRGRTEYYDVIISDITNDPIVVATTIEDDVHLDKVHAFYLSKKIKYADRTLLIEFMPDTPMIDKYLTKNPLLTIIFVLIIGILLIWIINFIQKKNSIIQKEVDTQVHALKTSQNNLMEANKKLEDYSYTISHDLQEPVRSIIAFSSFIKEDFYDVFNDDGKDYLNRIISASERMSLMIKDLLKLSRVGMVDTELKKVKIKKIVDEVIYEFDALKDARVKVKIHHMKNIICQPVWISSVFRNLISNCIKYKSEVPLEIVIEYEEKSSYHLFRIRDNGIGIGKEFHHVVFDLFKKGHQRSIKDSTGAGLAIVSSIVSEHGGKIWVDESCLGEGTTMAFTISKHLKSKRSEKDDR